LAAPPICVTRHTNRALLTLTSFWAIGGSVTQLNWIPKRAGLWSVAAASAGRSTLHEVHDHSAKFIASVLLEEVAGVADGRVAEGPSAGEELL
jgi:hypothetical protein